MQVRIITAEEWKYTYRQSMQICGQTGSIGYLRGDFGNEGASFYSMWHDAHKQWNTDAFRTGLDEAINALRSEEYGLLAGRGEMKDYVLKFPDSAFQGNCCEEYGFRADKGEHSFLLRCNPAKGDYDFYCFCYVRKWLDGHMANARKGIRFIDPHYKEMFRIPDGEKIVVTSAFGEKSERTCRYIDDYHTEIGSNLYHICEFAERMERSGAACQPKEGEDKAAGIPKKKDYER